MRKRKLISKKSKIFPYKYKLARLIDKKAYKINKEKNIYYWKGEYLVFGNKIMVYIQKYIRHIDKIQDVKLNWLDNNNKHLTPKEIYNLLELLEKT